MICLHVIGILYACIVLRREQPHNITLKRRCGFSYSLDKGITNDMPIHLEPLAIHCAIVEQIVMAIVNEYDKMIQHICISKVTHL